MCSLMHHSRSLPCDKLKINLAKSVPLPPKTSHPVKELTTAHAVYQSVLNNGISLAGNWKKHGKDVKKKTIRLRLLHGYETACLVAPAIVTL